MRIVGSVVARAPPEAAWAWWTDYGQPGDVVELGHGVAGRTTREVLARVGNRVVLRDYLPGRVASVDHEVIVRAEERRLVERHLAGSPVPYEATWRFEAEDDGRATRITRELDARVPLPGFLQELAAPISRRLVESDLAAHVRDLERDLSAEARDGKGA